MIKDTLLSPLESLLIIPCKPAVQSLFIHLCGRGEAGVSKGITLPILAGTTVWHASPSISGRSYCDNSGLHYLSGHLPFNWRHWWRVLGGGGGGC